MIITEIYKGQGLGNQLACYITTRVIAADRGFEFGIMNPQNFKGLDFFDLDFGCKVTGGNGPQGGPPTQLPEGIKYYYSEKKTLHPQNHTDIRSYDTDLPKIQDNTKIDGLMQGEEYIAHRKNDIRKWLKVRNEFECYEYADNNTCVINFRGGEYTRHKDLYLDKNYWVNAVKKMLEINKNFRFIVITDDVFSAKKIFTNYDVFHFNIGKDYVIIKNAKYLILSNSSFAWFPAWLNEDLKFCIAPKYWARHNVSDGYWSLNCNLTKGWMYLDKHGNLSDYTTCKEELNAYMKKNKEIFEKISNDTVINTSKKRSILDLFKKNSPNKIKYFIKYIINVTKNIIMFIRQPIDLIAENRRRKNWLSKLELENYRKKVKIYDIFNFFNELETLEIRLNILNDYVDYFVLVESKLTHTGKPKELFYKKNEHLFKKFEHKIIHYVIENPLCDWEDAEERLKNIHTPEIERKILTNALTSESIPKNDANYLRDYYEKESVRKALTHLSDDDFCYISDLDEIWNPEAFIDYSKNNIYKFKQLVYCYYLNNRSSEEWFGTTATKYKNIKNACINDTRSIKKTKHTIVQNGGWHFTFQGGAERIKNKIEAYSAHEINTLEIKSGIEKKLTTNKDIIGRYFKFWIDEKSLPKYLKENKEKYKNFFKK